MTSSCLLLSMVQKATRALLICVASVTLDLGLSRPLLRQLHGRIACTLLAHFNEASRAMSCNPGWLGWQVDFI